MGNERLGIVEERQADRERYQRYFPVPSRYAGVAPVPAENTALMASLARSEAENRELAASIKRLQRENEELRQQLNTAVAYYPDTNVVVTYPEVQQAFVEAYEAVGGRANDNIPVTVADLTGPNRTPPIAWPRHVCMLLCRRLCVPRLSTSALSKAFGGRDHTVSVYAFRQAPLRMAIDQRLKAAYVSVLARFGAAQ